MLREQGTDFLQAHEYLIVNCLRVFDVAVGILKVGCEVRNQSVLFG